MTKAGVIDGGFVVRTAAAGREDLVWILPMTAIAAATFLLGQAAGFAFGVPAASILANYSLMLVSGAPPLIVVGLAVFLVRSGLRRSGSPFTELVQAVTRTINSPMSALPIVSPLVAMPLLIAGFGALKQLMPLFAPFAWDDTFASVDRALFLGRQPWTITHQLFGSELPTRAIDAAYSLWVPFIFVAICAATFLAKPYDRARFFLTFSAQWVVLGIIMAYMASSAGPCFAGRAGTATAAEFSGLMDRLQAISSGGQALSALYWQDVLWDAHVSRGYGFGMGISAMPSMHNAITVLYALALGRIGPKSAAAGWIFVATIFIGSIHLGLHYAIDGIVAAAATTILWKAAGWHLERAGYPSPVPGAD